MKTVISTLKEVDLGEMTAWRNGARFEVGQASLGPTEGGREVEKTSPCGPPEAQWRLGGKFRGRKAQRKGALGKSSSVFGVFCRNPRGVSLREQGGDLRLEP